jgi:FdhE protein
MTKKILEGLERAKEQNPALAEIVDLHHDLLQAQAQVQVSPAQPQCDEQQALASLQQGTPLLHSQELTLDWEAFGALFAQVCRIAAQHRDDLAQQFQQLLALQENDPGQVRALAVSYLGAGDRDGDREDELLSFVLNHALRPFLLAFARAHAPLVRQEYWKRGQCPVCGGEPDMAFLEEEPVNRYLVCSRCDAQWLFGRIKCAFCANDDPHKLSFYPSEDKVYRVYTCQKCQRYLKAIDLRKARQRVLFPVERVTMLALDIAAREKGYA